MDLISNFSENKIPEELRPGFCYRCNKRQQFKGYAWCDICLLQAAERTAQYGNAPKMAAHTLQYLRQSGLVARLKPAVLKDLIALAKRISTANHFPQFKRR